MKSHREIKNLKVTDYEAKLASVAIKSARPVFELNEENYVSNKDQRPLFFK
jgi:hypothetical protein